VRAIVGADLTGEEVDGLPVVRLEELTEFLLSDNGRPFPWEVAKRVLGTLEAVMR